MSDFETVPVGTMKRLEQAEADRDEAFAKGKQVFDELLRMKDERAQAIQQAVKQARMEWAKEDKAELDRLKAEWQADELSAMIAAIPFSESLARGMLKHRRDELRIQAEEGSHE